ncbi:GTPase IMAP family member 8-like protein [Labeo rohita]|uniref:GTPase IMAP family member 8-like protein n=1 Tax=Labeo rohita TaxID=84645 RepID=A0A498NQW0_LABRO|nr:GTPase IMAP family member 8-like protein [Labeo rohita]
MSKRQKNKQTELRAVLIGRQHSGKTSVINTILETSETETEGSTDEHVKREGFVDGKKVSLVETPGCWKTFNPRDLSIISKQQLLRRISLISPGPHAVLIVIRGDSPFTDTDGRFLEENVELLVGDQDKPPDDPLNVIGTLQQDNIPEPIKTLLEREFSRWETIIIDGVRDSLQDIKSSFELRAVLIGRQHSGKTSVINTILETSETESEGSTDEHVKREGFVDGKKVSLVETPGCWKTFNPRDLSIISKQQLLRRISLISPGPHAVLIVIRGDSPFTDTDGRFLEENVELLGPNVWTHTLIIFTRGDLFKREDIEQHIREDGSALKRLIEKCENKYHVFNNSNHHNRTQVKALFEKIEGIVEKNNGKHFDIDLEKVKKVNEQWEENQTRASSRKSRVQKERSKVQEKDQDKPPDDPLNVIGTLQQDNIPEPIKTLLEREFRRWESIIIDGVRDSLQDIKSSFELRAVLIGRQHSGKTSVINTILETSETETEGSRDEHVKREGFVDGRKVSLVETPGCWKTFNPKDLSIISKQQLLRRISLISPGPHAVLIVIRADSPFTDTDGRFLEEYVELLVGDQDKPPDDPLNVIGTLQQDNIPEPIKTLLEREFSRWESIIIDGVRDSLQDIKSSFANVRRLEEIRVVLLGWVLCGKSSAGNTILNRDEFAIGGKTGKDQDKPPDDPLNVIGTLQQVNIPEPIKTLLEREFRRWESIIIDGVRDSLQDIKSSFELRAVLIGRQHSGKTSVINTILETSETETEGSTDEHVKREGFVDGRKVSLVETPGCWKTFNPKDLSNVSKQQLLRRISLISPGPHAVLIVIRADSPFTDTDRRFLEEYVELLGPNIWTHTLIIFTRGDLIKQEDIEQHIQENGSALKRLIEKCENNYQVFNNLNHHDRTQVKALFEKIEGIVGKKNGKHFDIDLEKVKKVNEQWKKNQTRASLRKSRVQKERSKVQEKVGDQDKPPDDPLNVIGTLQQDNIPEPIKTLLEREFSRWESIIIDGVRDSLQDIKSSFVGDQDKPPDDPLNVIGTLQQDNIPEPIKTLLEREFSRWESIIIDGVRDSLQDIKSSFELRAVLIGRQHSGKTSVINTILETSETETEGSTDEHVKREGFVDGRKVSLVETPGCWKTFNPKDLSIISKQQLLRRISLISPGPHAVLIVIRADSPFTDTDGRFLEDNGKHFEINLEKVKKVNEEWEENQTRASSRKSRVQKERSKVQEKEFRAVLIGRRHSGKTSVINTILETSETETEGSTDDHVKREGFVDGRKVSLVETPGWWKTFILKDLSNISKQQLLRRISLISPGPHAVLIVIRGDSPFTDTDRKFLEEYVELLGPNVWTHTLIIFTRGDLIKQEDIEQHIREDGSALKRLFEKCENKYHVFNNSNHHDRTQVKALFKKIEGIVEKNNGKHFDIDLEKVKKVNEQWEENQTRASSRKSRVQKERSTIQEKELRAVLIGHRHSGRTSVINTILETSETETEGSTDDHVKREGFVDGRKVSLVETPGCWKTFNPRDLSNISKQQLLRRISLISPGPHAVLIVIRADSQFTDIDGSFLEEYVELLVGDQDKPPDDPLNEIGTLQQDNIPEPIKTLLEREFSRWETIIIDGVRDSLQDIKSSFELSQAEKRQKSLDAVERWLQNYNHYVQHTIDKIQDPESGSRRKRLKI